MLKVVSKRKYNVSCALDTLCDNTGVIIYVYYVFMLILSYKNSEVQPVNRMNSKL